MEALTPRALDLAKAGQTEPATFKITALEKLANGSFGCIFTDGSNATIKGRLTSQVSKAITGGTLQLHNGDIVSLQNYVCNNIQGSHLLIVTALNLVNSSSSTATDNADAAAGTKAEQAAAAMAASPATTEEQQRQPLTPVLAIKQEQHVNVKQEQCTPAPPAKKQTLTPGPTPSPSEEPNALALTPVTVNHPKAPVLTTLSASPLSVSTRAGVQPIAALNPYDTKWCIKAKVVRKAPPRSFSGRNGAQRVFNVELADTMGTQIQGTFWREAAEKYLDILQEGKVYYFSSFQVKVANKQYATVKNDYEIHFDARTEVEEAADQTGISGDHKVEVTPLDKLPRHVGRKMPVDVLGVVVSIGPMGTIKRKADNTELPRRDVTLADSSGHSVVLTLWADQANRSDLDGCEGKVMQVTTVRVGDFNGCSLSAVTRSQVTLNPEGAEADALRQWWETDGRSAVLTPLGQANGGSGGGLGGSGSGGARANKLQFLSDVLVTEHLPSSNAKPTYHDVIVAVTQVNDGTMYYLANPENGKKVEPKDGRFWCESEGRFVDAAHNRYVLSTRVADATNEIFVSMFNDQGAQLLGQSADDLAALKSAGDDNGFRGAIKSCQWSEWAMTITARSRDFNGERRMRYAVNRMAPVDYILEGYKLLQLIQRTSQ